jgi:prepilin-type N-terminal cleavage/methylation domain-containing protein
MRRLGTRSGFTLLELIIVMAILVGLAGLAVAKLDVLQLKSEKAAAAMDMRNVSRLIQTFRATTNFYPDRWDSLIHTGGTLQAPGLPGSNVAGLDPGLIGANGFSPKLQLLPAALTAEQARSLTRLGITTVYDHDATTSAPYGNGFTVQNIIGDPTVPDVFATIAPGHKIIASIYPTPSGTAVVPSDRVLVVFGLGKWTTIVGSNLQSAVISEPPTYPYSNDLYYNRYLAVFEAYNNGDRCRLVAVLGADGDLAADELADFNKN